MENLQITLILIALFGFAFLQSCKEEEVVTPDPIDSATKVTYTADVAPIFNASCALSGCHASGSSNGSLATYASAKSVTQGGELVKSVKHVPGAKAMPVGQPKLSDEKIAKIEAWITDGYLE